MTNTQSEKHTHTELPWILEHDEDEGSVKIWAGSAIEERHTGMYDSAGEMELYSSVYGEEEDAECLANAQFIVEAVNQHYGLKAENKKLLRTLKLAMPYLSAAQNKADYPVAAYVEAAAIINSIEQALSGAGE